MCASTEKYQEWPRDNFEVTLQVDNFSQGATDMVLRENEREREREREGLYCIVIELAHSVCTPTCR